MRLFLSIQYDGTAYSGWQRQPTGIGVQAVVEDSLAILLNQKVVILGAGRTDAGVHATAQMAHLDWPAEMPPPDRAWLRRLNGILPKDIAVPAVYEAARSDLHARFDALSRSYSYQVARTKLPLLRHQTLLCDYPIQLDVMREAAAYLLTVNDFKAFMKTGGNNKTSLCTLTQSEWRCTDSLWTYHVTANRFLRGMVRALVGAQLALGRGQLTMTDFQTLIAAGDRRALPANVGAKGLIFCAVEYSAHSLIKIAQLAPENLLP